MDISKLKEQVKKIAVHPGEEIIHVLPQEYKVDSEEEIIEPIGYAWNSSRSEVSCGSGTGWHLSRMWFDVSKKQV